MASKTFTQWTLSASTRTTTLLPLVVVMAMWTFGMDTTRRGCASSTGWKIWISPHVHSLPRRFTSLVVFISSQYIHSLSHRYPTSIASLAFAGDGSVLAIASSYMYEQVTPKHQTTWHYCKRWSDSPLRITLLRPSQKTLCSLDPCRTRRRGLNEQKSTCAVSTSWLSPCILLPNLVKENALHQTLLSKSHYCLVEQFGLPCWALYCLDISELVYLLWI